ncbi:MAG: PEP-CTERM sorting domain-containing protein [Burkholderiales bacterium]
MSGFLDNIAAALIGASVAGSVFRHRVHIGYLAAIVGASNAGGAGSVLATLRRPCCGSGGVGRSPYSLRTWLLLQHYWCSACRQRRSWRRLKHLPGLVQRPEWFSHRNAIDEVNPSWLLTETSDLALQLIASSAAVPEPSTLSIVSLGLLALMAFMFRSIADRLRVEKYAMDARVFRAD